MRREYENAANSPKSSPTRKEEAQKKARRLRVAIKHVIEDHKPLPPKGPPLIPGDALPIKAHTPHRRRADEAVQALHRHRAYKDGHFLDRDAEEQYHFDESAFNRAWHEEEANRQFGRQRSTTTAPLRSGHGGPPSAQRAHTSGGPSVGQVEDVAIEDTSDDDRAARERGAAYYHKYRVGNTIRRDEAQARRLKRAEDLHMVLDNAQSIVDPDPEERRARRGAGRAPNQALQTSEIVPLPAVPIGQPRQPVAQQQPQHHPRPEPTARAAEEARSEDPHTDTDCYDRLVRGRGRRQNLVQRMGQAAAKNWRQGHLKTHVQEGLDTSEARNDARNKAPDEARRGAGDEAPHVEAPPRQRRIPKPPLGALGKLGGAVANRWRHNGYPPDLKKAEPEQRDAQKAQRQAEAQARNDRPSQSAAKRIGGAMAGALHRGRVPPSSAGRAPVGAGQAHGTADQAAGSGAQVPSGTHVPSGAGQGSPPSPTIASRRQAQGSIVGISSERELHGVSPQASRSGVPTEGFQSSSPTQRPMRAGSAQGQGGDQAADQGRDLPQLSAVAEGGDSISRASSAPSFNVVFPKQGSTRLPGESPPGGAVRAEAGTDRCSEASPPTVVVPRGGGTGRRSGSSALRSAAQDQSHRSKATAHQGLYEPTRTPPAAVSRPDAAAPVETLRGIFAPQRGPSGSANAASTSSVPVPDDENAHQHIFSMRRTRCPEVKGVKDRAPRSETAVVAATVDAALDEPRRSRAAARGGHSGMVAQEGRAQRPSAESAHASRSSSRHPPRSESTAARGHTSPSRKAARKKSSPSKPPWRDVFHLPSPAAESGPSGNAAPSHPIATPSDEGAYESLFSMRRTPRSETTTARDGSPPSRPATQGGSPPSRPAAREGSPPSRRATQGGSSEDAAWSDSLRPPPDEADYKTGFSTHRSPRANTLTHDQALDPRLDQSPPRAQNKTPPEPISLPPGSPSLAARRQLFTVADESPQKIRP